MILKIPSIKQGEYNTEIIISEKKERSYPFWVVDVTCSSPEHVGKISSIQIKDKELELFFRNLAYIQKEGSGKISMTAANKKEFSLKIRSMDSMENFIAEVFIKSRSTYMKLSYEIDLQVLIALLKQNI